MVLFGLSILLVSFSVIVYRYQSARLSPWTGKPDSGKSSARSPTPELEDDDEAPKERSEVPTFTLDRGDGEKDAAPSDTPKVRQVTDPRSDASPKPSSMSPPPQAPSTMMPPPPRRPLPTSKRKPETTNPTLSPSIPRAPPTLRTSLRPPPSAASTLRAPTSRTLAPPPPSSLLSTSTLSPSTRPSKKVLLEPGHSPLDWAHLTANPPTATYLRGADVPPQLIRVPPSAVQWHNGRRGRDAWGVWQGKVYNLTPYLKFHPGGEGELMRGAGKVGDGERLFREVHPWVSWENMLGECLVGILVSESEAGGGKGNELEEMD